MVVRKCKWKFTQSCPTLCDPMDYKVHGILQARILEWVFLPFSRGASQTRDRTQVFHSAGGFFTSWVTREAGSEKTQKLTNKPMSLLIGKVKRRAKLSRLPWVQEFQEENGIKIGSVMWEIDYGGHTATSRGCLVQGVWDRDRICPFMLTESRWNLALTGPVIHSLQGLTSLWDKKARMEKGQTVSRAA